MMERGSTGKPKPALEMPIALLSILFTVLFMNAAAGALATLASLIVMELLVVLPAANMMSGQP